MVIKKHFSVFIWAIVNNFGMAKKFLSPSSTVLRLFMWHSLQTTLQTHCVRRAVVEYEVLVGKHPWRIEFSAALFHSHAVVGGRKVRPF